MKILALAATSGLLAFGAAGTASAFYFTPHATTFTAVGSVTLTAAQTHVCTTTLTLNTDGSGVSITSATFSGRYCGGVAATGCELAVAATGALVRNQRATSSWPAASRATRTFGRNSFTLTMLTVRAGTSSFRSASAS